jgi:integrase
MFKDTGKWVSSGCYTRADAIKWAEKQIRRKFDGTPTLEEFAKDFFTRTDRHSFRALCTRKNRHLSESYYTSMNGRLKNYILPKFGGELITDIKPYEIDDWFVSLPKKNGKRGEELADDSKNKVLSCLSEIMDEAVRLELTKENPCRKIQEIIARGVPREIFNEEEMAVLFPENDAKAVWVWRSLMWACYFHIMKCTGFRPGEIAGLRRENYYPELKGVFTTSSVNSGTHKFVNRIKTTGSGKEYKVGLLSDQCCRLLDKYIASLPPEQDMLFLIHHDYIIATTSNKHFVTCVRYAGIDPAGRTQYCLRHTFQTRIAGEVEKESVEELMGHTRWRQGYDHRDGERRLRQLQGLRVTLDRIV